MVLGLFKPSKGNGNKREKDKSPLNEYVFDYKPREFNKGKQSLQEMSLIDDMYNDYLITKTGYLVSIVQGSGINLDLLNAYEQEDCFNDYNAFLMATVGESVDEIQQSLDMTVPVDFDLYVLYWKKRYIEVREDPKANKAMVTLAASYLNYYEQLQQNNSMSTKKHIIALREKIKDKSLASLEQAAMNLEEKVNEFIRNLESSMEQYDIRVFQLNGKEIKDVFKHLINFSNRRNQ